MQIGKEVIMDPSPISIPSLDVTGIMPQSKDINKS